MTLEKAIGDTLDQLCNYVEVRGIGMGTSVSAGVSQVKINDVWYEIQMRLEREPTSFIGERDVVNTQQVGDTIQLS